jgi:uncharacterized Fe-S cluster-containing radical SAM superfamily protein
MGYKMNPGKLGKKVLTRISGKGKIIDNPVFALYNLGRRLQFDHHWGEVYVNDVVGCNYRCAHCWVCTDALNGNTSSGFVGKKTSQFPGEFKGEAMHRADDVFDYLQHKARDKEWKVFAFTGGETSFYRGGLKRMAERAREAGDIAIGIDTNGWLISQNAKYLDKFEGLQDVMNFYVSVKGVTPEEFSRFTGVDGKFYDAPFKAIERLLKRGFQATPGGVVLNTIAHGQDGEEVAEMLHARLAQIHPQLPALVSYHKISTLVHDRQELSRRMQSRGYTKTKPSAFERTLLDSFERLGTVILHGQPENQNTPRMVLNRPVLEEIIDDLRG